jgi:cysteine desulfurase / selenocysteine lyase
MTFDVNRIRADFPALKLEPYGKPLIYLDNAASAAVKQRL